MTITLPADLLREVRARAGPGAVSSWIAQAVAERLASERLGAAIDEYEAEAGAITEHDIAAARARTAWEPPAQDRGRTAA